jgi:hypothetical protein
MTGDPQESERDVPYLMQGAPSIQNALCYLFTISADVPGRTVLFLPQEFGHVIFVKI